MEEKTVLRERYELLQCLNDSTETVRWKALDRLSGKECELLEFFSPEIMRRQNGVVSALPGKEVQYKSLSDDFEELFGICMAQSPASPVIRPLEVFRERGAVWAVVPVTEGETLEDWLARRGPVSWVEMKRLIGPVAGFLGQLHAQGSIHRGVSPETLLVDREGRLLLSGFTIPPARTEGSEIRSNLFFGYSAPEQYSSSSWQGTWTDVYSLAAVCYRMVTGTVPVEWRQRSGRYPLYPPREFDASIPDYGSDAIEKGLRVDLSERYRTVEEFWRGVLEAPGGTIPFNAEPIRKRTGEPEPPTFWQHGLPWVLVGVLGMSVVVLTALLLSRHIAFTYITDQQGSIAYQSPAPLASDPYAPSEPAESEEGPTYIVPDFVGGNIEEILLNSLYQQMFSFEIERMFSETRTAGTVLSQSPEANTPCVGRTDVLLRISKGSERITMPAVVGLPYETAAGLLTDSEIRFVTQETDSGGVPGTVAATSMAAGSVVYRTQDVVTIWVCSDDTQTSR